MEGIIGAICIITIILLSLSVVYYAGWKDGIRSEKDKTKWPNE